MSRNLAWATIFYVYFNDQLFKEWWNDETIRAISHSDIDRDCVYVAVNSKTLTESEHRVKILKNTKTL